MDYRFEASSREVSTFTNQELRDHFLIENVFHADSIQLTYSIYDRMIIGGAKPVNLSLELPNPDKLKAEYFLERREMGVINVGGNGCIEVDGNSYEVNKLSALYIGRGSKKVVFKSKSKRIQLCFIFYHLPLTRNSLQKN